MEKKCQRCVNTLRLNISPLPPAKEELTDNHVGQTRVDISKMETVGAKNAHTEEVVVSKKEIATDENVEIVKKNDDCKFMLKTETISDYSVEKVNLEEVDLTLDDAIKHATEVSEQKEICKECSIQHKQLATWLIELKKRREDAREYGQC